MRKVLVFGLTFSLAGASLYACADSTDSTDDTSGPDAATPDGKSSPTFGDTYVPDSKVTGEDDSSTDADTGPKDSGKDADASVDASDSGVVVPPGAGNFTVVRVGAAGDVLSSAAFAVFLEERQLTDGAVVKTVALPTAVAGAQNPITLRGGTGTAEGALSLSSDNAYLMVAGYTSLPATLAPNTVLAATAPRVVARIDKTGAFDTSTLVGGAFDTGAPRGVASADGMTFYVAGEGGALGTTGGIHYLAFGDTTATQIFSDVTNLRGVGVFGGQLYGTTQSGATDRLFTVGTALPTTTGQTATEVPDVPATIAPDGFVMLDTDAVAGVDTMYVADTAAVGAATTGGVSKWKLGAGGTWALATTFKSGFTTSGPLFVNATIVGTDIIVVATTAEAAARVIRFVDDGVDLSPTGVTIASSTATQTTFRGVAFPAK